MDQWVIGHRSWVRWDLDGSRGLVQLYVSAVGATVVQMIGNNHNS